MKTFEHIVLLGAGAVGVLPAVKLMKLDTCRFTVAADRPRVERYRRNGIYLNKERIAFTFASPDEMADLPSADLILAATKTPSLAEALDNVKPLVSRDTVFLPLLNGITASDVISEIFPGNTVLKGYFLGHASVREDNFITHDGVGNFYIGGETEAVSKAAGLFRTAGIPVCVPDDIISAMWKKFVLNVGVNQTQAVFLADYGTMQNSPEMLDYARNLMEEAVAVARAEKVSATENMVTDAMKVILDMPGNVKTSMLQDVLAGRLTEVDAFAGTVAAKAEIYGIPVPYNRDVLSKIQ